MKVLVVDDDPVARRVLEASMRKAGYEPVMAIDGVDALRMLKLPDSPRLIVMDWLMPRLDGVSVCRELRAARQDPYVYILLLTGKDRHEEVVEGLDAGADDYMTKPCNLFELRARLRVGERILKLQDDLVASRDRPRA
jgi:two-component system cell cycle response regulator